MLSGPNKKVCNSGQIKAKETRGLILSGIVPAGLTLKTIISDLWETKEKNVLEGFGFLSLRHFRGGRLFSDHGLVSCQLVTHAFTSYLISSLQDSTANPMDVFKYHASGTDSTVELNSQTALISEVESRVSGTQVQGATSNIYKTVATVTYTAARSIVEHGVFSAAAAGTMLDRSVFTAVPVVSTDTIEFTYQLTANAES